MSRSSTNGKQACEQPEQQHGPQHELQHEQQHELQHDQHDAQQQPDVRRPRTVTQPALITTQVPVPDEVLPDGSEEQLPMGMELESEGNLPTLRSMQPPVDIIEDDVKKLQE